MKLKISGVKSVYISGEFIKLDSLLKYASLVSSGGEAKVLIKSGDVYVNKEVCTLRGKKIKPGTVVRCGDNVLLIKQGKYDS